MTSKMISPKNWHHLRQEREEAIHLPEGELNPSMLDTVQNCIFLLQAFSAYYYVMKFLNLTSEEPYSQEKVIDTVEKFCSLPWEEVSDWKQQLLQLPCALDSMEDVSLPFETC